MGQRHKHADVIIAWANGETVQVRRPSTGEWQDLVYSGPILDDEEYRIKPKPVIRKYRVALISGVSRVYPSVVENKQQEITYEKDAFFVRWLTDWIEYEVKE